MPAARSVAASAAATTASQRRAAGERGARGRHRAVAVAVGLDDRAQPRARRELAPQARDVALDRREVHAGDRADRHVTRWTAIAREATRRGSRGLAIAARAAAPR